MASQKIDRKSNANLNDLANDDFAVAVNRIDEGDLVVSVNQFDEEVVAVAA